MAYSNFLENNVECLDKTAKSKACRRHWRFDTRSSFDMTSATGEEILRSQETQSEHRPGGGSQLTQTITYIPGDQLFISLIECWVRPQWQREDSSGRRVERRTRLPTAHVFGDAATKNTPITSCDCLQAQ